MTGGWVMDNASAGQAGRPRRLWRIVLVVSLALNLCVAGLVAGALSTGRLGDGPPRSFNLGQGPVIRALTPQERRGVLRSLRGQRGLQSGDLRGHFAQLRDILDAPTLDTEALRALMTEQMQRNALTQSAAVDGVVTVIAAMSPERRAAFTAQLTQELSRPRRSESPRNAGEAPRPSGG